MAELGLYRNAWAKEAHCPIDLENIAFLIESDDQIKIKTEIYRNMVQASGKTKQSDTFKAESFPALTLAGYMPGERKGNFPQQHTGLYQVDVDDLDPMDAFFMKAEAEKMPEVVFAYISLSHNLKIVVRSKAAADKQQHYEIWESANRQIAKRLKISFDAKAVDWVVKAPNGFCFINHDSEVCYNPQAEMLPFVPVRTGQSAYKPRPSVSLDRGEAERALAFLAVPQDYATWLKVIISAKVAGCSPDFVERWSSTGKKYQKDEVLRRWSGLEAQGGITHRSLFWLAYDAGWQG